MTRRMPLAALATACLLMFFPVVAGAQVDPDIDATVAAALADTALQETLETESIGILQSDAPWAEQYRAARILAGAGSVRCVEPLAAMLTDPARAHLARYALEPLPFPEVDAAFRKALETATGPERLGLLASVENRRDAGAVPAMASLLADPDAETARAAARALGAIGTPEAVAALTPHLETDDTPLRLAAAEACLTAAEHLAASGDKDAAIGLYELLGGDTWPGPVRAGAFAGILAADPEGATARMMSAMGGDDPLVRAVAVAAVASLEGDDVTARFAEQLPALPAALQAALIEALSLRDDPPSLDVLHGMLAFDGEAARMAALKVLADRGDTSSVGPLCALLGRASGRAETSAVVETLCRVGGEETDKALVSAMERMQPPHNATLADVLARRRVTAAWGPIHGLLADESARPAAFRALGRLAKAEHMHPLLEALDGLEGDAGRAEAEEAVADLGQRMSGLVIRQARYGAAPDGPWADVTETVAGMLEEGITEVPVNNGTFGDPAPNVVKTLQVEYEANAVPGTIEAGENQTLSLDIEAGSPEAVGLVLALLEHTDRAETIPSCLRVLGMLGGPEALAAVESRIDDVDPAVHDAAVRVLAGWQDPAAVSALARVAATTAEANHRVIAVRGCVRMLREGSVPAAHALVTYDQLIAAAQTADERRAILSGLADVAHPAALAPVRAFHADEALRAEADIARERIQTALGIDASQDFTPIFNGTSLEGWAGEPALWRAEDDSVVGESTPENPVEANTFLTWEGGEPADFELRFRYRTEAESTNSGIQIRSERFEGYRVRGYQADIATDDWITGICYEEGGRGILARRGEWVTFGADGAREAARFEEEEVLGQGIRPGDWNDYHVVAWGNQIVTRVNGRVTHVITDNAPEARAAGVLAFQLHTGPPMRVRFADIALMTLPPPADAQN
jgi:HEAT repeat protein